VERSREAIKHLRGRGFHVRIYVGARHELFNELKADDVTEDVVAFIQDHL
jgi:alpha-beta hydrolase superfamily lysophospholipase